VTDGLERLTAQDLLMLWPDEYGWSEDIGVLAILDGARLLDGDGRVRVEEVRRRLDPSRPLWEAWLLPGLPDRRVGLLLRAHHAMVDGVAGVAAFGALLDTAADAPLSPVRPWTPVRSRPRAGCWPAAARPSRGWCCA
jgi:hypothetical protein